MWSYKNWFAQGQYLKVSPSQLALGLNYIETLAIGAFLSQPDAESLIHAFINTSRLNYWNALYSGLPDKYIKKLYYIQNSAARVLTQHISPVLY